jgi:nitroimidazol reductase NimA-like FMN-containing flavoprotein (pyridoxamine 5'-phosphate oxidase superfamily)
MLGHLDAEEIETLLNTNVIGRIGCAANSKVYVVPITYVYDAGCILGHTVEGMKIDVLRKNPACCFQVDEIVSISNWKSVIAWGTFQELIGVESDQASEKLVARLAPFMDDEASQVGRMGPISTKRISTQKGSPIIYRIQLTEKTGRYEK